MLEHVHSQVVRIRGQKVRALYPKQCLEIATFCHFRNQAEYFAGLDPTIPCCEGATELKFRRVVPCLSFCCSGDKHDRDHLNKNISAPGEEKHRGGSASESKHLAANGK